jgi:UDP-glucuronate decarboxylase
MAWYSDNKNVGLFLAACMLVLWFLWDDSSSSNMQGASYYREEKALNHDDIKTLINSEIRSQLLNTERVDTSSKYPPVKKIAEGSILRILVTGGAGFVGSNLVDRLMMAGHHVVVVDNMFTGRQKNIIHWLGHPSFQLIIHDVVEPIMLEVDQIYHLACPASPPHYQYNPIKTIKTSTEGTLNMLGLAKRVGARMLLSSTSEVYGDPEVHPQKETYWGNVNPIGPRACYDEGKRVAETMMYAYETQGNVEVRVARIFNTFGPRMHPNDGRVVSNFIIQALQGKDITIYGTGSQTRSFQFVDDLVEGLIRLMNGNYTQPVNIGNPDEYTMKDFAYLIKEITKSNSTIKYLPANKDDPRQRKPDITVANTQLGWKPVVPVKIGLAKAIEYFRQEIMDSGEIIPTGPVASKPQAKTYKASF